MRKLFLLVLLCVIAAGSASAANLCKKGSFTGTYTRLYENDVFNDGTHVRKYAVELVFTNSGSVILHSASALDLAINVGASGLTVGSWKCRDDGKLVVTSLVAGYYPLSITANTPHPDMSLEMQIRATSLFEIVDNNTLRRIQQRARIYRIDEDPTDPSAGSLSPLSTIPLEYKRLEASDADLLVP